LPHALPIELLDSLQRIKGFDEAAFIAAHATENQITSIRVNPVKSSNSVVSTLLSAEKIPWCTNGYYLQERPSFTLDPHFHAGAYYVQEASSMFLETVMKQTIDLNASLKVLDLCAAPGGKSTLIQSLISTDSFLVSNEVIKTRVNILAENITKWGAANVVVTNNDPKDFQRLSNYFDAIIVDAPCSGSGLFRKDNEAISEWSMDNVALCSQRQQRILADVVSSLKPGGVLIYSTCSYSEVENENIAEWLTKENTFESCKIDFQQNWGIVETEKNDVYGYRFYPDKIKGEGFFIAALKKNEDANAQKFKQKPISQKSTVSKSQFEYLSKWVNPKIDIEYFNWKNEVIALPYILLQEMANLQSALYIKKIGVNIGSAIRNELIPSHELAVSTIISPSIEKINLKLEDTLQFLRHQHFELMDTKPGWKLIMYNELPLGFIKSMSNRFNNYYPREWRIFNK
jgi:NOL1/NOP2/sun family putative RNA methylase